MRTDRCTAAPGACAWSFAWDCSEGAQIYCGLHLLVVNSCCTRLLPTVKQRSEGGVCPQRLSRTLDWIRWGVDRVSRGCRGRALSLCLSAEVPLVRLCTLHQPYASLRLLLDSHASSTFHVVGLSRDITVEVRSDCSSWHVKDSIKSTSLHSMCYSGSLLATLKRGRYTILHV